MNPTPEQLIAAQKSQLESLFALTGKAVEGLERLAELNIQTLKSAVQDTADTTLAALSAKDPQDWAALQPNVAQPLAEKALAYAHRLYEISSGTQAEFVRALEAQAADAQGKFQALVDTAVKNAPAGTEPATALLKSAMSAATNAIDSVQKASRQAAEVVEANINTVANNALKAAQTTATIPTAANRAKRTA